MRARAASLDHSPVFYSVFNQAYILNVHSGGDVPRVSPPLTRTHRANSPGGPHKKTCRTRLMAGPHAASLALITSSRGAASRRHSLPANGHIAPPSSPPPSAS